jgi:hypothetical protein
MPLADVPIETELEIEGPDTLDAIAGCAIFRLTINVIKMTFRQLRILSRAFPGIHGVMPVHPEIYR